ncbi:MAG TPA: peptidoglycan DD-metalloendopeptidase family protein [Thermoanaerobaculia bacterium]
MPNRRHTFVLMRGEERELGRWEVSGRRIAASLGAIAAIAGLAALSGWLWLSVRSDRLELTSLRQENQEIRSANESFEERLSKLQERLADSEERTRRLAIVAGVESLDGGSRSGLGGELRASAGLDRSLGSLERRAGEVSSSLDRLESRVAENFLLLSSTPSTWPVGGMLSSGFGWRRDPLTGQRAFHDGVDVSAAPGRPVQVTASGIIAKVLQYGGLGRAVYVAHGYGVTTVYGHMSRVLVKPGQRIDRGATVGLVGNTGRSTGYHLHYEVQLEGKAVNPLPYMLSRGRS